MKKILVFCAVTFLMSVTSFCQKNNPFDQVGQDFIKSVEIIQNDFKAGLIKEMNQETIDSYSKKIPLTVNMNAELAASIAKKVKSSKNLNEALEQLGYSKVKIQILGEALNPNKSLRERLKFLEIKVEELTKQESNFDNDNFLKLLSIVYHSTKAGDNFVSRNGEPCTMTLSGSDGEGEIPCVLGGAIIGGVLGFSICSWPCAAGGAVIGAVLGAIS